MLSAGETACLNSWTELDASTQGVSLLLGDHSRLSRAVPSHLDAPECWFRTSPVAAVGVAVHSSPATHTEQYVLCVCVKGD